MIRSFQPLFYGPLANVPRGLLAALFIWSFFWKGLTLWRSARNNQKYWYIALLIINTLGILEIIYLSFFQKLRPQSTAKK
jgi:methionyl-tRNA synthetase